MMFTREEVERRFVRAFVRRYVEGRPTRSKVKRARDVAALILREARL